MLNYLFWALLMVPALCCAEKADVSIFVFLKGEPLPNIQIKNDGHSLGQTDALGNTRLSLTEGEHSLKFFSENDLLYTHDVSLQDGEILQLLVDFKVLNEQPIIDSESSQPNRFTDVKQGTSNENQPTKMVSLTGLVISAEDQSTVSGARVFISGLSDFFTTDSNGVFHVEIPEGSYNISVLQSRYNSQIKNDVNINNENDSITFELTPAGSELPEFVVVVPFIEGSLASVLEERKSNNSVANYLSTEQISKSGDSDAAGALKRVTGLTLVDGKFIFVRGLGERYSTTLLNGANLPSPDPTRRVVPLDLFPTGIIESIEVQKGYSAKLPAEFGGGSVTLKTVGIPKENFLKMGISYGQNTQTTGKDGLQSPGGSNDWTGYDDGTRSLPSIVSDAIVGDVPLFESNPFFPQGFSAEQLESFGEALNRNYQVKRESIDPNLGFSTSAGMRFELDSGPIIGFSTAVEYDSAYQTRDEIKRNFTITGSGDLLLDSEDEIFRTTRDISLSGFLTTGVEFNDRHQLSSNLMVLRSTQDFQEITEGFSEDLGNARRITEIRWTERQLRSFQLFGEHNYPNLGGLELNWQLTDSDAAFDEPDNRLYRYDRVNDGRFLFSTANNSNARIYRALADLSRNIRYDLSLPLAFGNNHELLINFGQNWVQKDRNSDIRRIAFENVGPLAGQVDRTNDLENILNEQFIDPNGYQLIDTTRSTDNYFANLDIKGSYLGVDYSYDHWFRSSLGLRSEQFDQAVTTFQLFDPNNSPVIANLSDDSLFPSFSSTFVLQKNNEIRINFAETATRPDFKELSPAQFKDPVLDRDVEGNPDLVNGTIKHYDLRWDKYFSSGEFFSVSLFYKEFFNPIEIIIKPGSTGIISFDNALSAENSGIELELYKDLSFIHSKLENFYLSTNYARIESEILLAENNGTQTNSQRPLQGQSPYVANFQFGYDNIDKGISSSLLFNVFGERISEAGTNGQPDVYEQPFNQLDFVYSQKLFDHWKISFKAKNLLNDTVIFQQGEEITREFKKGREFSLGFSYDFF